MEDSVFKEATEIKARLSTLFNQKLTLERALKGCNFKLEFTPAGSRNSGGLLYIEDPGPIK
jgi:hypothetical protein